MISRGFRRKYNGKRSEKGVKEGEGERREEGGGRVAGEEERERKEKGRGRRKGEERR